MAGRGIHFAITDSQLSEIRSFADPVALFDHIGGHIEEVCFESGFDAETDKAWPWIHQTLVGDNPCAEALNTNGPRPLSLAVMGEESLCESDWYMVNLTMAQSVPAVHGALQAITREDFEARMRSLLQKHDCPEIGDGDVEYTGYWFENMKKAFEAAAAQGRHVIFTVDY